jgi:hypothetical protein
MSEQSVDLVQKTFTHNQAFWTEAQWQALSSSQSITDLTDTALTVLQRLPQPVGQVCGPISNGGLGSIEANLEQFRLTISKLVSDGKTIFDQMPFEDHMMRLTSEKYNAGAKADLLDQFYLPIFRSGLVRNLYFIPDWQSSAGALWEHQQAQRLGLSIHYLS